MKKQWPEDVRRKLGGLLRFVRLEKIRVKMEEDIWKNLD